jgi:Flp pilus assembly pilin Flp
MRRHPPEAKHGRRSRLRDDDGLEVVEYALLLALLVATVAAIFPQFTADFAQTYTTIVSTLSAAMNN